MKDLTYWEEYLAKEEERHSALAAQVQGMMDDAGLSIEKVEELAKIDIAAVDPALLQELELSTGVAISQIPSSKPAPTASRFMQRTKALRV